MTGTEALSTTAVLVHGTFGRRLGELLARDVPNAHLVEGGDRIPDAASSYVVVHAGRDIGLRDALDEQAFARGVPGFGVELVPTRVVCGPVTIPGATACYACFLARGAQHRVASDVDAGAATLGLDEGFGPQHVALARGLAGQAFAEIVDGPAGLGGTVRSFDLVTGTLGLTTTVAVDRCPRCSARFDVRRREDRESLAALP